MHLLFRVATNISNFIPFYDGIITVIQLLQAMQYGVGALRYCGAIFERAGQFLNMRNTANPLLSDITEASNEDQYEDRSPGFGTNTSMTLLEANPSIQPKETLVPRKRRKISHGDATDVGTPNASIDESRLKEKPAAFSFAPQNLRIMRDGTKNTINATLKAPTFPFDLPRTKERPDLNGEEDDILDDFLIPTRGLRRKQSPALMVPHTPPASISKLLQPNHPSRKPKTSRSTMAPSDIRARLERETDRVVHQNATNYDTTLENRGESSKNQLGLDSQSNGAKDSMPIESFAADADDLDVNRPPTRHGPVAAIQLRLNSRTPTPGCDHISANSLLTVDRGGALEPYHGPKTEQPSYTQIMRRMPPQDTLQAIFSQQMVPAPQILPEQPKATSRNALRRTGKAKSSSTIAVQPPNQELPGPQARAMQVLMWTMQKEEDHRKEQDAKIALLHDQLDALENEKLTLTDKVSALFQEKSQLQIQVERSAIQLQKFKEITARLDDSTIGLQKDLRNYIDKHKDLKQENNAIKIDVKEWKSQAQKAKLAADNGISDVKMLKKKWAKRHLDAWKAIDSAQDERMALQDQVARSEQLLNRELERFKHLEQLHSLLLTQQPQENDNHALEVQKSISTRLGEIETSLKSLNERSSPMQEMLNLLKPLVIDLQSSDEIQKDNIESIRGLLENIQSQ
jgi:hypothetical protein